MRRQPMHVRMWEHTFRSESEIHRLKEFPGNPIANKAAREAETFPADLAAVPFSLSFNISWSRWHAGREKR